MGCAVSTSKSVVPTVVSNVDGVTTRAIKLSDNGQLDLSELDLKELPPVVASLGQGLQDLALEKNVIDLHASTFADTLKALVALKRINLEGNRLTDIPEHLFAHLPKLEVLSLRNNALKALPASLRVLGGSLVELNLERNFLSEFPEELGELRVLRILSAGHNVITGLPAAIKGCVRLDTLWLQHNRIRELCEPLCDLAALDDLNLYDNRLSALPDGLPRLAKLKWLSLGKNRFDQLPASVYMMPALETLHLQENRLKALPTPPPQPDTSGYRKQTRAASGDYDPFGEAKDYTRESFTEKKVPAGEQGDGSPKLGAPPVALVQETASTNSSSGGSTDSSSAVGGTRGCPLRIVWLSGNPLASEDSPPPALMQLPNLKEVRMKNDSHGKCVCLLALSAAHTSSSARTNHHCCAPPPPASCFASARFCSRVFGVADRPLRSSSFDMSNWKAAMDQAKEVEVINAQRRRGSFKKNDLDGDLTGSVSPAPRRRVSFTNGQLPGMASAPGMPSSTMPSSTNPSTTPSPGAMRP